MPCLTDLRKETTEDEQTLDTLFGAEPEWLDLEARDEPWVEVQMRKEEGRGCKCRKAEVQGSQAGLKLAKGLARQSLVGPVSGLQESNQLGIGVHTRGRSRTRVFHTLVPRAVPQVRR